MIGIIRNVSAEVKYVGLSMFVCDPNVIATISTLKEVIASDRETAVCALAILARPSECIDQSTVVGVVMTNGRAAIRTVVDRIVTCVVGYSVIRAPRSACGGYKPGLSTGNIPSCVESDDPNSVIVGTPRPGPDRIVHRIIRERTESAVNRICLIDYPRRRIGTHQINSVVCAGNPKMTCAIVGNTNPDAARAIAVSREVDGRDQISRVAAAGCRLEREAHGHDSCERQT